MPRVHGRHTSISLDGTVISSISNNTSYGRTAKAHETTTYGLDDERHEGGLKGGKTTVNGFYESGATGPADVVEPLLGTTVEFIFMPEGVGAGKPSRTGDVLVVSYNESVPVGDYITWSAELQHSGPMVTGVQA